MAVLIFKAQFHDDGDAATGLTVTVNVHRITLASGAYSQVVTAGSATEMADGLYFYRYADADLSLYDYSASFNTAGTADQTAVGVQGLVVPDALVSSRLAPTDAGRTLDVAATGEASANVTKRAGVAVAAADANGNDPVVLYGTQGAVTFGQVKIVADVDSEGALIVENNHVDGLGVQVTGERNGVQVYGGDIGLSVEGGTYGQSTYGGQYGWNIEGGIDEGLLIQSGGETAVTPTWATPSDVAALQGENGDTLETLSDQIDAIDASGTAQAVWEYTTRTLTEGTATTTDSTASGSITRKRGNSWSISLALGSIASYTSLWFTIKRSYDDADSASLLQVKLNSPSANDGLLYVNGAAASNAALGSITVSDANTGAIVIAVDETITDDLAPGTYYYDCQMLNTGNVTTPDSGTFTITADVTRSVT